MPCDVRWIISRRASALHAAAALEAGLSLADTRASVLAQPAGALAEAFRRAGGESSAFFAHAVPLAVECDEPRAWAETVVAKTLSTANAQLAVRDELARSLTALERAFDQVYPDALAELELRSAPLREQWEARGGGLLAALGRVTERALIVPAADVVLVQPVLGGGGTAHALYNTVSFEAVLANAHAPLPEVLRLGWLLAQLHLDLPLYGEALPPGRIQQVGALALLPAALTAGQQVELTRDDPETLALALRVWLGHVEGAQQLAAWWQTYQADRPAWSVALAALERMLAASG